MARPDPVPLLGTGSGTTPGNGSAQGGPNAVPQENFLYYYHPDHLGSSSYVTDANGKPYEHLEYFPFGETWVQESSNTQRTPYLFTGKELDEETGLYYYGARYYDPRTSVWQSADPVLAKYLPKERNIAGLPGMGGVYASQNLGMYSYTHNNPVRYIDPDGNSVVLEGLVVATVLYFGGAAYLNSHPEMKAQLKQYFANKSFSNFKENTKQDIEKIKNLIFNESKGGDAKAGESDSAQDNSSGTNTENVLAPNGTPIGTRGQSRPVREVNTGAGNEQAGAEELFDKLTQGGTVKRDEPGHKIVETKEGTFGIRAPERSKSGHWTVDVNAPSVPEIKEVKFLP